MRNIRGSVEESVDSVATVALHHTEPMTRHMALDDVAQISESLSWPHHGNRLLQTLVRHFHQFLVLLRHVAHEERLVEVSVEAAMVHGHIHIAQVAVLQRPHVGDAVTDHLIDGRAAGFWEVVVVQWTWVTVVLDGGLMDDTVYLIGGHSHCRRIGSCIETQSAQASGNAHSLDLKLNSTMNDNLYLESPPRTHLLIVEDLNRGLAPLCLLAHGLSLGVIRVVRSGDTRGHGPLLRQRERPQVAGERVVWPWIVAALLRLDTG